MKVSFVIPCYRSQETLRQVVNEIKEKISEKEGYAYQIVLVNDGSPDNVISVIEELAAADKNITAIDLMHNFGQANARMAGMRYAVGDFVVCLDDDGQCPVDRLWDLLEPLHNGYDCAIAKYPHKKQSWFKNFGSKFNRMTTRWILETPKEYEMSNFFAFNQLTNRAMCRYKNPYPYASGLILQTTRRIALVEMEERNRLVGDTGYTLKKLLSLWMNGFTNFSVKPLRVSSLVGAICAGFGFLFGLLTIVRKILIPGMTEGYASLIASIFFVGGMNMLMLGLAGEYVGRIFLCINEKPQFLIRNTINEPETLTYEK